MATQDERIRNLKQRVQHLAGGYLIAAESNDLSPVVAEQFWRRVVAFEEAPTTDNFRQLKEAGVELPEPPLLDDDRLHSKLWEVIHALARLRVFISETDHLDDRELYSLLWHTVLREEVVDIPAEPETAWHVDLLGGGSEEDIALFLRHYADEKWRQDWRTDNPDYAMPPHEDPPFDRDRFLPKPS